jgi:hypothetical protein
VWEQRGWGNLPCPTLTGVGATSLDGFQFEVKAIAALREQTSLAACMPGHTSTTISATALSNRRPP